MPNVGTNEWRENFEDKSHDEPPRHWRCDRCGTRLNDFMDYCPGCRSLDEDEDPPDDDPDDGGGPAK